MVRGFYERKLEHTYAHTNKQTNIFDTVSKLDC